MTAAFFSTHGREAGQVVEHFFRHEAGKMVSTLTRIFGVRHLNLAEDVVQETLVRALQTWPYYGVPNNPAGWIMQVARNLALDLIRREKNFRSKQEEITHLLEQSFAERAEGPVVAEDGIQDDRLRMMFVCCHPLIPRDAQVALALKTLCGFGVGEIARGFLTSEDAVAKKITRAKQKIRTARIPFEIPAGPELAGRLDAVLETLYLLFNEGYKASVGNQLIREELCREAIRLASLLAAHPLCGQPRTHALVALMLLNGARLHSRIDGEGNILRLEEQDRSSWDAQMIARGLFHLAQSTVGEQVSAYHLQAAIAACHAAATDYASTDWRQILSLYDRLIALDRSPVVALNRAVAVANVHGPRAGLEAIDAIRGCGPLQNYYLLYAVRGDFEAQLGNEREALDCFRKALGLVTIESERRFLSKKIRELSASGDHPAV